MFSQNRGKVTFNVFVTPYFDAEILILLVCNRNRFLAHDDLQIFLAHDG